MSLLLRLLPYLLGAAGIGAAYWWAWDDGYDSAVSDQREAILENVRIAQELDAANRAQEREMQDGVNDALQRQARELVDANARLVADLDRLHERADRPVAVPGTAENTGPQCEGATGAQLSRPDAAFLVRLAARADRLRAALRACYDYADAIEDAP